MDARMQIDVVLSENLSDIVDSVKGAVRVRYSHGNLSEELRVSTSPSIMPGRYVLKVNGAEAAHGQVWLGRRFLQLGPGNKHKLDSAPGEYCSRPGWPELEGKWLPEDEAEAQGLRKSWGYPDDENPEDAAGLIADHAHRLHAELSQPFWLSGDDRVKLLKLLTCPLTISKAPTGLDARPADRVAHEGSLFISNPDPWGDSAWLPATADEAPHPRDGGGPYTTEAIATEQWIQLEIAQEFISAVEDAIRDYRTIYERGLSVTPVQEVKEDLNGLFGAISRLQSGLLEHFGPGSKESNLCRANLVRLHSEHASNTKDEPSCGGGPWEPAFYANHDQLLNALVAGLGTLEHQLHRTRLYIDQAKGRPGRPPRRAEELLFYSIMETHRNLFGTLPKVRSKGRFHSFALEVLRHTTGIKRRDCTRLLKSVYDQLLESEALELKLLKSGASPLGNPERRDWRRRP